MVRKNCSAGQAWDSLLRMCLSRQEDTAVKTEPAIVAPQQTVNARTDVRPRTVVDKEMETPAASLVNTMMETPTASLSHPVTLLTPTVWLFVLLAVGGSILVLTVWIVIFRRSMRNNNNNNNNNTPDDAEPGPEPVPVTEVAAAAVLLLSDGHSQNQTPSPCAHLHQEANPGWTREGGNRKDAEDKYSTTRVPLPATELGGTALVTTKTV